MMRLTHHVANVMSIPPSSRERHVGAVSCYADQRLATGHVSFSFDELLQATGLSTSAARSQLHRLRPKIVRVSARDTFFLIVTPEYLSRGAPPVEWWIGDYFKWLGRPYYLALQTAARLYGSNPQSIQTTQVMTDRARRPLTIGQQRVQFMVKRPWEDPGATAAERLCTDPGQHAGSDRI
jgi:AbiEi antitoxin C-terminal domain